MARDLMIELMIINGSISLERAEELIKAHYDEVESEWIQSAETAGAFNGAPDEYSFA